MNVSPFSADMPSSWPRLIGDVGGTNARFALETASGKLERIQVLNCGDHPSLESALAQYLADVGNPLVRYAALAIANPVDGDWINMTNHHWRFSISGLQAQFGFEEFLVANDFAALAMAVPGLASAHLMPIGESGSVRHGVKGVIGPGTGLGVAYLVPTAEGWQVQATEGGHVSLAPDNRRESDVLEAVRVEYGHVSAERLVSGIGLPLLYRALCALDGVTLPKEDVEPAEIARRAQAGECPVAAETFRLFSAWLGSVAGNLALSLGSQGGIYIGGGIVPRLGDLFDRQLFRQRFEAKGRFAEYLRVIPTQLITAPYPALAGSAVLLQRRVGRVATASSFFGAQQQSFA